MGQIEDKKRKQSGGFLGPNDIQPIAEEAGGTGIDIGGSANPETTPPKKPMKWLIPLIIGLVVVIIIIIYAVLRNNVGDKRPESTSTPQPKETIAPYSINGFHIIETNARLIKKEFASAYPDKNAYYDAVFNQADGSTEWDNIAPIANLEAIQLNDLKSSMLVFALAYEQDTTVNWETDYKMILEGLSSGTVESSSAFASMPQSGLIYLPLEKLVLDASQWTPGTYHLSFLLKNQLAFDCDFAIVK